MCRTAASAEWCTLAQPELQNIDDAKSTRHYQVGESIYHQGESCKGIYCIESGLVGIRVSDAEGNSRLLYTVEASHTFGYGDFFTGKSHQASAYCLQEATICHIGTDTLRRSLHHNPELGLAFLAHAGGDLQQAHAASVQQALFPVRTRLAHLLLGFKDQHGTSVGDGTIELILPISWQEAAELVGARPETVSRSLQALAKDGVLHTEGRRVTIPDLDVLLDEVESPAE